MSSILLQPELWPRTVRRVVETLSGRRLPVDPTKKCGVCGEQLIGYFEVSNELCADRGRCLDDYWSSQAGFQRHRPDFERAA